MNKSQSTILLAGVLGLVSALLLGRGLFAAESGSAFLPILLGVDGDTAPTTATPTAETDDCQPLAPNVINNASFENDLTGWSFKSKGGGEVELISNAYHCDQAARITLTGNGGTTQFFQAGVALKPNTAYRLTFAARATDGHDIRVDLLQHGAPYDNYGLSDEVDLTGQWQEFQIDFTTAGFNQAVDDGRFRFRVLQPRSGQQYFFDKVHLMEQGSGPTTTPPAATATSTPTLPAQPTATMTATPTNQPPAPTATATATPPPAPTATPTEPAPPTATATATPEPQPTATPTPEVSKPVINAFSAEPSTIESGESSTLSWDVEGEDVTLHINHQVGNVTGETSVTVSPNATTSYKLTASNSAGSVTKNVTVTVTNGGGGGGNKDRELLVYDWNGQVTEAERGFPRNTPPLPSSNIDWTSPINYAEGTLYFRVEIRSQPQPQDMQLQYCIWQDNHQLENCAPRKAVRGTSGNVVTWSGDVEKMWMKNNEPIDWTRPRMRDGIAIKNSSGKPVSPIGDFNWGGEDPKKWYPINWRFTVVVVPKGETFSGWGNWIN